jgi:hypothetical protein
MRQTEVLNVRDRWRVPVPPQINSRVSGLSWDDGKQDEKLNNGVAQSFQKKL